MSGFVFSFYSFMDFSRANFTAQEKIELLQRWVLVHSYLYYHMDISVVDDWRFDDNSHQLYGLKLEHPEAWANARYTYAMDDFDGSTGCGYVEKLKEKERKSIIFDVNLLVNRHVFIRRNN